jgi:hypothetical protein
MELNVTMIPALEDPGDRSPGYQRELGEFAKSLTKAGVEYEAAPGSLLLTAPSPFIYGGRFVIKMIEAHGATVVAAVAAWLHGRSGRKVRLKVGEVEAQAQTVEEVEKLLKQAQEIQQRNQPKAIHES